ncbi:hypothetical protein LTR74_018784 [Friedmanniomyces endolithicus]|nr:hypothetical protein LTR74_018784 [Friedmanniomyces endolithicus]
MSLECLKGLRYDDTAEVWACGKIAFWLLTGDHGIPSDATGQIAPYPVFAAHLKTWDCKAALKKCHISASGVALLSSMLNNNPSSRPSAGGCLSDVWFTEFVPRLRLPSAAELFEPLVDLRALVGNDGKAKDSDTHGKAYPMCNIVGYLGESFIASLGRDFPRQDWPDLLRADSSTVFLPSTEAQTTRCCSCEPSDEPVSQTVTRMHHQWGRQLSPDEFARALQSVPEGHEP